MNDKTGDGPNTEYRQARTPEGIERISEATFKHGGRKAEKLFYRGQSLEPHFPAMYSEILADQPELAESLDAGGLESLDARRVVEAELLRRIWYQLVATATSPKDLDYFASRASVWFKHAGRESGNFQDRHLAKNNEEIDIIDALQDARGQR